MAVRTPAKSPNAASETSSSKRRLRSSQTSTVLLDKPADAEPVATPTRERAGPKRASAGDYSADVATGMSRLLTPERFLLQDEAFVDIGQLHVSPGSDYASDVARSQVAAGALRPRDVQAVLISGTSVVRHLQERPFALYQLHVPLLNKEHVAFRRYSDFVELDARLREPDALGPLINFACCGGSRELPPLPAKTLFWEDSTSTAVVSRRWGSLQLYLDAALEAVQPYGDSEAWAALKEFLNLA